MNLEKKLSLRRGDKTLNSLVIKVDHANKHNSINLFPSGNAIKCSMKQGIVLLLMCTLFLNPTLFVAVNVNRQTLCSCTLPMVTSRLHEIKTVKGNWGLEH